MEVVDGSMPDLVVGRMLGLELGLRIALVVALVRKLAVGLWMEALLCGLY